MQDIGLPLEVGSPTRIRTGTVRILSSLTPAVGLWGHKIGADERTRTSRIYVLSVARLPITSHRHNLLRGMIRVRVGSNKLVADIRVELIPHAYET